MSSNSLNDLSTKYLIKSPSSNDGSEQSNVHSNSGHYTEDRSSIDVPSIEQISISANTPSIRSAEMTTSPISTAVNSIYGNIESSAKIEDMEASTKRLQIESRSFNSHTHQNYEQKIDPNSKKIIGGQLDGDLELPLAEEQDTNFIACGTKNPCSKKGLKNNEDSPMENLVSVTLAFKEASHNQCDLLRAQTSAINRLATAIEDQNVMLSRFHNVVQKTNAKNYQSDDSSSNADKL